MNLLFFILAQVPGKEGVFIEKDMVWLLSSLVSTFTLWLIWLTVQTFKNKQDIRVNITQDIWIREELDKIYERIGEVKNDFQRSITDMETRLMNAITLTRK